MVNAEKKKILGGKHEARNGFADGFMPLESLDLSKIKDADEMLQAMSKTSFAGRGLGEAADVLYEMITDPDCFVVATFSGAMTVAKMSLVICDMIDYGLINAVVSTGALMAHGLVETTGQTHFKYNFEYNDDDLGFAGYDRVYDTLELETNLDNLENIVRQVFTSLSPEEKVSSRVLNEKLGEYLIKKSKQRGIVKSAREKNVPIYIPAFSDSELGLDFALFNRRQKIDGKKTLTFDPFLDLEHFAETILKQKKIGIFTIGGGVPRNWAQQVAPYLDLIRYRIVTNSDPKRYYADKKDPYIKEYTYGVRICPEPVNWGGLSGCTYSEGVSWGKFKDPRKGGKFAEVLCDATAVWPLLVKGTLERLKKNKIKISKKIEYA
ncbi:MAG: deoxyhypusine synthase family protein [Patescibacteria group bacterium]